MTALRRGAYVMPYTNVGTHLALQISQGLAAPVFLTGAAEFLLLPILAPFFSLFQTIIRLMVTPGPTYSLLSPLTISKQELVSLKCIISC
jgi:hypothetical protein